MNKKLSLALCLFMSCDSDLFGSSRTAGCGAAGVICADGEMCDASLATPTCVPISITPIPDPAPSITLLDVVPSKSLPSGGNTVVLSGTGFVAASDSQVTVLVNGNPATNVHVLSSTQISFTAPADTRPQGTNSGPVSISVTIGTQGPVTLRDKFSYVPGRYEIRSKAAMLTGVQLRAVAVGRVNADRYDDVIAVASSGAMNSVMSFFADAAGSGNLVSDKEASIGSSVSNDVRAAAIGDYNSSAGPELAVYTASGSLNIYSTSLVGGQALTTVSGIPDAPYFVPTRSDVADELLFPIRGVAKVYQYVANGAAVMMPSYATGNPSLVSTDVGAAAADIDGDGRRDFITYFAGAVSYQAFIRTANGGYTVSSTKILPVAPAQQQFVLGDVTGDSKADLVYMASGKMTLQPSSDTDPPFGTSYTQTPPLPNASMLGPMTLAHVNARTDRVLDVVLITNNGTTPDVLFVRGSPSLMLFDKITLPANSGTVSSVTPADLNGDGLPDLVLGINSGMNSSLLVLMHNGID